MISGDFTFANPWFFALLLLLPFMVLWHLQRYRANQPEMRLSSLVAFKGMRSWRALVRPLLNLLKIGAFALLVMAMARPQNRLQEEKITADGIDIVMVMDVSGSMLARDFEPDRLGASKKVAGDFIDNREFDRIGLVVFAGESFTQCPITTDANVLQGMLKEIKSGLIEDGTAIGMGLATAVNRLKESDSKSKVVILLTDGVNNSGFIDPLTAAEAATQFDVKVYTIGVGTQGQAPYPVQTLLGTRYQYMDVQIDEELLEQIAVMTGGKYFRATDNNSLKRIYDEIDKLEKTEVEVTTISRNTEQFHFFVILALGFLLIDFLLRHTLLRGIT